jgi:hypothetical protein
MNFVLLSLFPMLVLAVAAASHALRLRHRVFPEAPRPLPARAAELALATRPDLNRLTEEESHAVSAAATAALKADPPSEETVAAGEHGGGRQSRQRWRRRQASMRRQRFRRL